MKGLAAIVLAAGKGTRMKSARPKVLHRVGGRPMLSYPLDALGELRAERVVVVVGFSAEDVIAEIKPSAGKSVAFTEQKEQLGTGHAVMTAMRALRGFKGDVLILSGDVPLITSSTIKGLARVHRRGGKNRPVMTVLTAVVADPTGYGRVLRDSDNAVSAIVEHKDATTTERAVTEINTGIYLIDADFLKKNIKKLGTSNAQGEYYLPDLVGMARAQGKRVAALTHVDTEEVMGVNNRVELARADRLMRRRINEALMLSGVTIIAPETTYIDSTVRVGQDTVIGPGVHLTGSTTVGSDCVIENGAVVTSSSIGDGTTIRSYSVVEDSTVGAGAVVGPIARLRPGTVLSDGVKVGNFVEIKKSVIGQGSKVNHLTYIGDTDMGAGVNVGAGTITCNYDGVRKHRTTIEDGAFIGSDTQLVAPVTVGTGAYIGSGTTVTTDVPPYSLATSRAEQKISEDWVIKKGLAKGKGKKPGKKRK